MTTIGSLFAGIGGLELGLEWAGLGPTLWQVEREPFCRAVLAHHWPSAERFDDVRCVGEATLAPVDLICGGFPCQDVSSAGKGAGLAGERSGLWREFARIVGELRPTWVVVENVASGARRWLDAIVRELEQLGYACLPIPVSASDCGAPHQRKRIFVVAHLDGGRELQSQGRVEKQRRWAADRAAPDVDGLASRSAERSARHEASVDAPHTDSEQLREQRWRGAGVPSASIAAHHGTQQWWSAQPGLVPLVHGLSGGLAGRRRCARIRALGNAVVPQCAEVVGWVIRELIAQTEAA